MDLSIIIPVKNSDDLMIGCLTSVRANLLDGVQVIIVSPSYSANFKKLINSFFFPNITLLIDQGRGIYSAMNLGLAHAEKKFVLFLGADDRLRYDFIDNIYHAVNDFPKIDIFYGSLHYLDTNPIQIVPLKTDAFPKSMFPHPCTVARKEMFEIFGNFKTDYLISSDYDWALNLFKHKVKFMFLDSLVVYSSSDGYSKHHPYLSVTEDLRIRLKYKFFGRVWPLRVFFWSVANLVMKDTLSWWAPSGLNRRPTD